jgi:hypothetical protein
MYQSTYKYEITSDMYRNIPSMPHHLQQLHLMPVPMSSTRHQYHADIILDETADT